MSVWITGHILGYMICNRRHGTQAFLYYAIFTIVPLIIAIIIKLFLFRKLKQKK